MPVKSLLAINRLGVHFGPPDNPMRAVDGIDFSVERGETVVLVGESGSGKSITALSILRLLPHAARVVSGEILLDGANLLALPEYRMRGIRGNRVGMIFQEPQTALNPVLTIGDQVGETLCCHKGLRGALLRKRAIELLDAVGIPEPDKHYGDYPHQFSGGMKQRVGIAIAMAGDPELLIADEPTTALDVTIQAQMLDLLKEQQKRHGMGILFITHDLGVAYEMADRLVVMKDGQIVERGSRDDFYRAPQHAYSKQLFDALPSREKRLSEGHTLEAKGAEPILEVANLKVYYPIRKGLFKRIVGHVRAVDDVSLTVTKGSTVAVVGESGSGKTTMGKGILQLLPNSGGSVRYRHEVLSNLPASVLRRRRSDIQIVFQDPYASMNPRMMVTDIIQEGMLAQGIGDNRTDRIRRVDELLAQVGLESEYKNRYPHEFSGGQRQRICIARALAVEPELIVCDEPTSALDVSVQAQILDLLRELQERRNLSYLFITHNIGVVAYIAHYVAVMYKGRIVEQGKVDDILERPQHDYTRQLLEAVPQITSPTSTH